MQDRERRAVARYETALGRRVYALPLEVFPGFFGNAYLILGGAAPILVDTGSGQESSNRDLARGLAALCDDFGEAVTLADLGAIIVTHGHIDHFGGTRFVRRSSDAPIAIHALDRRVLTHYEERLALASQRVASFLDTTGVRAERRSDYVRLYRSTKELFQALPVERTLAEGPILDGELEAWHVPGHCPGQLCLRVDDVLLTADHVLPQISPHLSPERIALSNGVSHYFASLAKLQGIGGVRLGLGGHGGAIADPAARADEIRRHHDGRLARLVELCSEPRTVAEVSREIFGRVRSYHVLLALLEAGALVEYLHERGDLVVTNADELERSPPPALLYRRA